MLSLHFHLNIPTSSVLLETLPNKVIISNKKKNKLYLIFFPQLIRIEMIAIFAPLLCFLVAAAVAVLLLIMVFHLLTGCKFWFAHETNGQQQEQEGTETTGLETGQVDMETAV